MPNTKTIQGEIFLKRPIERNGNFLKIEIAVRDEEGNQYGLQAIYKKAYIVDDYNVEDIVQITYDQIGKQFGGKVYNNLNIQHIEMIDDIGTRKQKKMNGNIQAYRSKKKFI